MLFEVKLLYVQPPVVVIILCNIFKDMLKGNCEYLLVSPDVGSSSRLTKRYRIELWEQRQCT